MKLDSFGQGVHNRGKIRGQRARQSRTKFKIQNLAELVTEI